MEWFRGRANKFVVAITAELQQLQDKIDLYDNDFANEELNQGE